MLQKLQETAFDPCQFIRPSVSHGRFSSPDRDRHVEAFGFGGIQLRWLGLQLFSDQLDAEAFNKARLRILSLPDKARHGSFRDG